MVLERNFLARHSLSLQYTTGRKSCTAIFSLRRQTGVILLDFSKEFDSVPYERLLGKLDFYGIRGKMLSWIKAFLSNRTQNVSVNGVLSSSRPVVSGVPQGSVLGPVLFILFINNISCSVQSTLRLFADDYVLYREVVTHQDCLVLQQDLHRLFLRSKTWKNGKTCIRGSQSHDCNREKSTAPSPVKVEVKKGLKHYVKLWTLRFSNHGQFH